MQGSAPALLCETSELRHTAFAFQRVPSRARAPAYVCAILKVCVRAKSQIVGAPTAARHQSTNPLAAFVPPRF